MKILLIRVSIRIVWCHSLKEKRMVIRSLSQRLKNKFNISIAEIGSQDVHQRIEIGIAAVCGDAAVGDSMMNAILNFINDNTEGEVIEEEYGYYDF